MHADQGLTNIKPQVSTKGKDHCRFGKALIGRRCPSAARVFHGSHRHFLESQFFHGLFLDNKGPIQVLAALGRQHDLMLFGHFFDSGKKSFCCFKAAPRTNTVA